jgi:hypothetical protein
MAIHIWRFAAILLVALLMGLTFAHVLERPAKMDYEAGLYTTLQRTLYRMWGPPNVGGFLEPLAIVATIGATFAARGRRRALWLAAAALAALLLAFPVVFFALVEPVNEAFRADPSSVPANWRELRTRWETGHTIRFGLHLAAFCALVVSVLGDRRGG